MSTGGDAGRSPYAKRAFQGTLIDPPNYHLQDFSQINPDHRTELSAIFASWAEAPTDLMNAGNILSERPEGAHNLPKLSYFSAVVPWKALIELNDNRQIYRKAFSQLRHLHITLTCSDRHLFRDFELLGCAKKLNESRLLLWIIMASPNLKSLDIDIKGEFTAATNFVYFESVLEGATWTRLETIRLAGLGFTENQLLDFFDRHKHTLKQCVLSTMYLKHGKKWSHLAKLIRDLRIDCGVRFEGALYTIDAQVSVFGNVDLQAPNVLDHSLLPADLVEEDICGQSDSNP